MRGRNSNSLKYIIAGLFAKVEDILVSSCKWRPQPDNVFGFAIITPKGYDARMKWGVSGFLVLFSPDRTSDFGRAAHVLADALTAEGVTAKAEVNTTADKKAVYILIGKKP